MAKQADRGKSSSEKESGGVLKSISATLEAAAKAMQASFWFAIVFVVILLIWSASDSRGVVIERLEVPTSLVSREEGGDVLAGKVLQRLTRMRAETGSTRASDALPADWLDDYRVEIPETGLAVGDLNKALRRWFGSDIYVRGEVIRIENPKRAKEPAKHVLFVWTDEAPSQTEIEPDDDLVEKAAEAIYDRAYPYLYAVYLFQDEKRREESTKKFRELGERGTDRSERGWALNSLALNLIDFEERCAKAIPILEEAHRMNPRLPNVFGSLSNAHHCLGRDQEAADATEREIDALRKDSRLLNPEDAESLLLEDEIAAAGNRGDYGRQLELYRKWKEVGLGDKELDQAIVLANLHEFRRPAAILMRYAPTSKEGGNLAYHFDNLASVERGLERWGRAAESMERVLKLNRFRSGYARSRVETQFVPLLAMDLSRAGKWREAERLVRKVPLDCYPCARARAVTAEARGRSATADFWFYRATKLAPRLPFAYAEWAEARIARGDLPDAAELAEKAYRRAPRWADPLKTWGDTFRMRGHHRRAARLYRAAAERAPAWGALHMDWGRSLWSLGNRREARLRFAEAAAMDLTAEKRAQLDRILRKIG
jgi:tetratricopeptide (TPR) repeat protein